MTENLLGRDRQPTGDTSVAIRPNHEYLVITKAKAQIEIQEVYEQLRRSGMAFAAPAGILVSIVLSLASSGSKDHFFFLEGSSWRGALIVIALFCVVWLGREGRQRMKVGPVPTAADIVDKLMKANMLVDGGDTDFESTLEPPLLPRRVPSPRTGDDSNQEPMTVSAGQAAGEGPTRVRHESYGEGTFLNFVEDGGRTFVVVKFDDPDFGVKRVPKGLANLVYFSGTGPVT